MMPRHWALLRGRWWSWALKWHQVPGLLSLRGSPVLQLLGPERCHAEILPLPLLHILSLIGCHKIRKFNVEFISPGILPSQHMAQHPALHSGVTELVFPHST